MSTIPVTSSTLLALSLYADGLEISEIAEKLGLQPTEIERITVKYLTF